MRLGVLASGKGSNLGRLLSAQAAGELGPAEVALVAVDRDCPAAAKARDAGIALYQQDARQMGMADWEQGLMAAVLAERVDALVLAGFMRILSPTFVARFPSCILNLHPSLLPSFPGRDAIGQAIRHGVRLSGATVHLVDETLDGGPIVLQEAVAILPEDDEQRLAAKIHEAEHRLLPQAVRLLAEGLIRVDGRKVTILEG